MFLKRMPSSHCFCGPCFRVLDCNIPTLYLHSEPRNNSPRGSLIGTALEADYDYFEATSPMNQPGSINPGCHYWIYMDIDMYLYAYMKILWIIDLL